MIRRLKNKIKEWLEHDIAIALDVPYSRHIVYMRIKVKIIFRPPFIKLDFNTDYGCFLEISGKKNKAFVETKEIKGFKP